MKKKELTVEKMLLGLALGGVLLGVRSVISPPTRQNKKNQKPFSTRIREGIDDAIQNGVEEVARMNKERADLKTKIGDGAHDPGSIVILPEPDADIVVKKYGIGLAEDKHEGTFIRGSHWGGYYPSKPNWSLHEHEGNCRVLQIIRASYSKGWREGVGEALAITVTHSFPGGFFPHRDASYADSFSLERVAMMLQATHRSSESKGVNTPLIVIDNREAHRLENSQLSESEDADTVRGLYGEKTAVDHEGAITTLALPDDSILHNEEDRKTFDPASGLHFITRGAGDRDYHYIIGSVYDGDTVIAELCLHTRICWRPGYGTCKLININREVGRSNQQSEKTDQRSRPSIPWNRVVALINNHPPLFWNNEHFGNAVIVDTQASPIRYYYG